MPLWAHGLMSKSNAFKESSKALEAVKKYKEMQMPVQSLILPLDFYNSHFTPDASLIVDIR
jgi:alpha-glucosidase (family GH31 glycosyl hydrolase)